MKSIKQLLNEQELVVGLMSQHVCSPWLPKLYHDAGADFLYIENEHLFFNGADLANMILAARSYGLPAVAKCEYVNRGSIAKLLDAGVTGIQLPMSETREQLAEVVSYVKFPPVGVRAAASGTGNTDYEPVNVAEWIKRANDETTVIAHIETRKGLENIDEILSVPGVDIMFIGLFDLTVSLGQPAEYDHPDVVAAINRLVSSAQEHGKFSGMWVPSYDKAEPWIEKGVRFFETTGDVGFIASGSVELMKRFAGHAPRVDQGQAHI